MNNKWFEKSYRRCLVDMHIPDWDEKFFSKFDPENYVNMIKLAKVDTAYIYTSSCVGLTNFPTLFGNAHKSFKGRDVLGEIFDSCHKSGINVVAYYNIWSKWAYDNHPEWRVINAKGQGTAEFLWTPGRYGVCCYNTPYRDFVVNQLKELCNKYEFEGLWIDMILLPFAVCYCSDCRRRYFAETGKDIPKIVNWEDPEWVRFQRKRQQWQAEFTALVTQTAKNIKPNISVGHNVSSYSAGWRVGASLDFFDQNDYLSGDISGDPLSITYTCKFFHSASESRPLEFMTSVADMDLTEHVIMKQKEYLYGQLFLTIANNGCFGFIDAIDPVGTLHEKVYKRMGELYDEVKKYEDYIDYSADFCQDVGIYTNLESLIDLNENGNPVEDLIECTLSPHLEACLNTTKSLSNAHIPFGVISKRNLNKLSDFQVIILPDLLMIDEDEVNAFRQFVRDGGSLYSSSNTSLLTKDGIKKGNFLLSDVFGVSYLGITDEEVTFIAPSHEGDETFLDYSEKYPLSINSKQIKVKVNNDAKILGKLVLPYTDPKDVTRFSSAISNPPGIITGMPSVVMNEYGKGKSIYSSASIESMTKNDQRTVFVNLIKLLLTKPVYFEIDAPKSVELTLFHQKDKKRYIINMVNFQRELPNIPINGINVCINVKGINKNDLKLLKLPEEESIDFMINNDYLEFKAPRLDTFLMFALVSEEG